MDVLELRAVVATVETGSFAKAATVLFSAPQTVKNHVDALEFELGVRLFVRTPKGAIPTVEARYLYEESKHIIHAIEKMTLGIRALEVGEGISFGCLHELNQPLRDRICADFVSSHPDVRFRYVLYDDYEGMLECVRTGKANVTFWAVPRDGESLEDLVFQTCPSIPSSRFYAVVLGDDPLARLDRVPRRALIDRSVVRASCVPLPTELASYNDERYVANDLYEAINHCLDGGVCIDCNYVPLKYDGLVRIPIDIEPLSICVVTKENPSEWAKAFVRHCVAWAPADDSALGQTSKLLDALT